MRRDSRLFLHGHDWAAGILPEEESLTTGSRLRIGCRRKIEAD